MKKLLLFLFLVLGAGVLGTNATTYTANSSDIKNPSSSPSSWTSNNITWGISYIWQTNSTYTGTDATKGFHIGSAKNPVTSFVVSTEEIAGTITSVKVNASTASSGNASLSVKVGDSDFTYNNSNTTKLTDSATEYEFKGTSNGKIEITISNSAKKAVYIKTITVEYTEGLITLGELSATYNNAPISNPLSIDLGSFIVFHADNATSFSVTVDDQEPINLTATDGKASWTPAVCTDANVSVIAKRENEDGNVETSDPLTFTLTVNKVNTITATWIITSAPSTTSGNTVDVDLTLDTEKSSAGKWHAYATNSYSSGISGGAQLGSSSKPFQNGTISLTDSDIPDNAIIKAITFTGFTNSDSDYTLSVTVNEVNAGTITVAKTNTTDHTLSDLNLTGNQVTFTTTSSAEKYLCVKGISIKYALPDPGEITVDYIPQYCTEANENKTELTIMEGAELTFTSTDATRMEITSTDEIENLPEPAEADRITWTPQIGVYTILVKASNANATISKEYTIMADEVITLSKPSITVEEGVATVQCVNGALKIKIEDYVPSNESTAMLAADVQDWAFVPESNQTYNTYKLDYSTIEAGRIILLSAKAVTPTAESDVEQAYLNNQGTVSGIENVAADTAGTPAVYYNLQGQRVEADRPGMYIRRQGGKAEKIVIR